MYYVKINKSDNIDNKNRRFNLYSIDLIRISMKQFETILFPQDTIKDIYNWHWSIIYKSTGVTWNVGPYKLIWLPGHPNLNLNLT